MKENVERTEPLLFCLPLSFLISWKSYLLCYINPYICELTQILTTTSKSFHYFSFFSIIFPDPHSPTSESYFIMRKNSVLRVQKNIINSITWFFSYVFAKKDSIRINLELYKTCWFRTSNNQTAIPATSKVCLCVCARRGTNEQLPCYPTYNFLNPMFDISDLSLWVYTGSHIRWTFWIATMAEF